MILVPEFETVRQRDPELYQGLMRLLQTLDRGFELAGIDPANPLEKPEAPNLLEVSAADGIFDFKITDNSPTKRRGISYFLEYDTRADFETATTLEVGAGRNYRVMLGNQTLYFRCYSQYLASQRSAFTYYGTKDAPTAVVGGGTLNGPTVQAGTGSGTSSGSGGGYGEVREPRGRIGAVLL